MSTASLRHGPAGEPLADGNRDGLARALGWLSLGLGVASLAAPQTIAEAVGLERDGRTHGLLRVVGLREIVTGLGLIKSPSPTPWLKARVAGDAMDLALLTLAMASPGADRQRVQTALAATLGITALDAFNSSAASKSADGTLAAEQAIGDKASAAITINTPLHEVYQFWDGFQNLPRFMSDFATVEITAANRSHWTVRGPAGISVQWDAEIIETRPDELIAWRTLPGSDVEAAGAVRFRTAPGDQGTEVRQDTWFTLPGGDLGRMIGELVAGGLGVQMGNDLRRAKQLIEIGEIVQSDDSVVRGPNPAQPTARIAA
jgi:uncharacterized membrane protein